MYKLILHLVLFLPPLSILAQTDSLQAVKEPKYRIALVSDTLVSFMINYEGDFAFYSYKIDNPVQADSLRKGLIPFMFKNKVDNFKGLMIEKRQRRDSTLKALVQTPIPDFDAPDTLGIVHRPAYYRGRVLLLHFFNFWDSSFDNEIPILNNLIEKYHGKGFEILSFMDIPITDSERKVMKEKPIHFPLIANARNFMDKFLPVQKSIPYLVLVDKAGHFRFFYLKNGYDSFRFNAEKINNRQAERLLIYAEWEDKIVLLLEESKF